MLELLNIQHPLSHETPRVVKTVNLSGNMSNATRYNLAVARGAVEIPQFFSIFNNIQLSGVIISLKRVIIFITSSKYINEK